MMTLNISLWKEIEEVKKLIKSFCLKKVKQTIILNRGQT